MQNSTIENLEEMLYQLIFADAKSKQIIGEFVDRYGFFTAIHKHYRMVLGEGVQGGLKALHNVIAYQHDNRSHEEYATAIAFLTGIPKTALIPFGKAYGFDILLSKDTTISTSERQELRVQLLTDFVSSFVETEQKS